MPDYVTDFFLLLAVMCIFTMSASGSFGYWPTALSITVFLLYLGVNLIKGKKIYLPQYFLIYLVFLIVLIIHSFFFGGQLIFFWIFLTGGLYWLIFFNSAELFSKYFFTILIVLGFSMFFLYVISYFTGTLYYYENLYHSISPEVIHNHLGDLWAIILVAFVFRMSSKFERWHFVILALGLFILGLSFSRSALISLVSGSIYIFYNFLKKKNIKKILFLLLNALILLFIYFGIYKTTIDSRPYFLQSLSLIFTHPLGVGVGNFSEFNSDTAWIHNLLLEITLGLGLFSLLFFYWLVKVIRTLYFSENNVFLKAILLSLSLNFMFDITYVIPVMIWIWFACIGINQGNKGLEKDL